VESMAVQQHENGYGVLETDIHKRVRAGAMPLQEPWHPERS